MAVELRIVSCATCPPGRASGVGRGGRCPLVDRPRRRGELVFLEGDPAGHIWFVKRGVVLLTRAGHGDGEPEVPRALRRAGSFIGLEALVGPRYLDTARVAEPAVLCGAPRDVFEEWLGPPDSPARSTLEQLILADAHEPPRAAHSDGSALARVARWAQQQAEAGATPVPRRFTAGLLGMTPETLSRALARLAKLGAIAVTRRSVRVVDPEILARAARQRRQHVLAGVADEMLALDGVGDRPRERRG
jgi:CRP-like cAMP-binding protein